MPATGPEGERLSGTKWSQTSAVPEYIVKYLYQSFYQSTRGPKYIKKNSQSIQIFTKYTSDSWDICRPHKNMDKVKTNKYKCLYPRTVRYLTPENSQMTSTANWLRMMSRRYSERPWMLTLRFNLRSNYNFQFNWVIIDDNFNEFDSLSLLFKFSGNNISWPYFLRFE